MFKLAHKPPRGPEDLSFSEGGQSLLTDTQKHPMNSVKVNGLGLLGATACVELTDILEDVASPGTVEFNRYGLQVIKEASSILGGTDRLIFIEGLSIASHSYLPEPNEELVA